MHVVILVRTDTSESRELNAQAYCRGVFSQRGPVDLRVARPVAMVLGWEVCGRARSPSDEIRDEPSAAWSPRNHHRQWQEGAADRVEHEPEGFE